MNALYREFRDQGLEVLLIDFRESPDHVRKVVRDRGYVAPVLLDESGDVTGRVYGVWGPPTIYLVDARAPRRAWRRAARLDYARRENLRPRAARSTVALARSPIGPPWSGWAGRAGGRGAREGRGRAIMASRRRR